MEAHGTGTKAGDKEELSAITSVFCNGRDHKMGPLLIGSVKSNMGHPEPTSGLCGVAKVLLAMQHKIIPPNLHFNTPNPNIPALLDGRLKVRVYQGRATLYEVCINTDNQTFTFTQHSH